MISQTCFMELDVSDRVQVMNKYNLMANYCLTAITILLSIKIILTFVCTRKVYAVTGTGFTDTKSSHYTQFSGALLRWDLTTCDFLCYKFAWIGTNQILCIVDHKITDPVSQVGARHNQGRQTRSAWGWGAQHCRRLRRLSTSRRSRMNTIWSLFPQVPWEVSLQREGSLPQGVSLRQGILPEVAVLISAVTASLLNVYCNVSIVEEQLIS